MVASVDADKHVVTFDRFSRRHFTEDYQNRLARYYLSNVFEGLGPGEFYLDRPAKTLYYKPKPGEDPRRAWVVVPRLSSVLFFDGGSEAGSSPSGSSSAGSRSATRPGSRPPRTR
jgi:hypothetical protein